VTTACVQSTRLPITPQSLCQSLNTVPLTTAFISPQELLPETTQVLAQVPEQARVRVLVPELVLVIMLATTQVPELALVREQVLVTMLALEQVLVPEQVPELALVTMLELVPELVLVPVQVRELVLVQAMVNNKVDKVVDRLVVVVDQGVKLLDEEDAETKHF